MLILCRKPDEAIRIGDEITVTILGVRGNQVRIGIDAPRSVSVHRQEIYDRIQAEQKALSAGDPPSVVGMRLFSSAGEARSPNPTPHPCPSPFGRGAGVRAAL